MDHELDRAIALAQRSEDEYAADLGAGWLIGGALNGGYLLAVLGNAVRATLDAQPDPIAMSAHFLSSGIPGPAVVRTRPVRRGGRHSTVAASLLQHQDGVEVERITALATYGDLSRNVLDVRAMAPPPQLPPPEACVPSTATNEEMRRSMPFLDRLDIRLEPGSAGWAVGEPSHRGVISGWLALADQRPLDSLALLLAVDSLPPTVADLGLLGWAPTLELTVHVRAVPAPGPVKVRSSTRNVADGYFEEDCEVWDSTDRLVAQSRQLALVPRPV